jgi:hypothetical protein
VATRRWGTILSRRSRCSRQAESLSTNDSAAVGHGGPLPGQSRLEAGWRVSITLRVIEIPGARQRGWPGGDAMDVAAR